MCNFLFSILKWVSCIYQEFMHVKLILITNVKRLYSNFVYLTRFKEELVYSIKFL